MAIKTVSRIKRSIRHIRSVAEQLSPKKDKSAQIKSVGYRLLLADQLGLSSGQYVLNLQKDERSFTLRISNVGDFSLLYDLFVKEEYARAGALHNVSSVIDFGSNIGLSAIYLRFLFPDADIVCFEPDRLNFQLLCTNIEDFSDIIVHNLAVGGEDGEAEFFENVRRGVSSSFKKRSRDQRSTRVPVLSFDSALEMNSDKKIDLLKFDIEGAEYELFRSAGTLDNVRAYIGELHTDLMGCTVEEFSRLFSDYDIHLEQLGHERILFFATQRAGN